MGFVAAIAIASYCAAYTRCIAWFMFISDSILGVSFDIVVLETFPCRLLYCADDLLLHTLHHTQHCGVGIYDGATSAICPALWRWDFILCVYYTIELLCVVIRACCPTLFHDPRITLVLLLTTPFGLNIDLFVIRFVVSFCGDCHRALIAVRIAPSPVVLRSKIGKQNNPFLFRIHERIIGFNWQK